MLGCIFESLYVQFRTGQIVEVATKTGFRWALEGAGITKQPEGSSKVLVIGDPDGDRGRQSLTSPRWGGLLLVNPAPPHQVLTSRTIGLPAKTGREARMLQLYFDGF